MKVLGCDPGLNGGLAVVARDGGSSPIRLLEAIDVPTEGEGEEVSPEVLNFIAKWRPDAAYIERAQAFPGQGISSAFVYGGAYFALRLAIRGCLVPLTRIESRAWKAALEMPARSREERPQAKEDSRQKALQLFPDMPGYFDRRMDHNRAEASLIAYYGMMLAGSTPAISGLASAPRRRRRTPRGPSRIEALTDADRVATELEARRREIIA
jgi:hypothetical protein